MGVVADVVEFLAAHVKRVIKIKYAKDDAGHWQYPEEIDGFPWIEKDGGKENRRNCP